MVYKIKKSQSIPYKYRRDDKLTLAYLEGRRDELKKQNKDLKILLEKKRKLRK